MRNRQVLIVANDAAVLWPLRSACQCMGFEVLVSPDGLHAAFRALMDQPELILLDASFSGIEPLNLCELLSRDRRTSSIPIVLLIDTLSYDRIRRCRALGVRLVLKRSDFVHAAARALGVLPTRSTPEFLDVDIPFPRLTQPFATPSRIPSV